MTVVYVVLPLALVIAIVAIIAFIWATRSGQFDDMETPGMRMLHDDDGEPRRNGDDPEPPPGSGKT